MEEQAIALVRAGAALDADVDLTAQQVDGFPGVVYVTRDGGRPLLSGRAYVVEVAAGRVTAVPSARPARVCCAEVRAAQRAG